MDEWTLPWNAECLCGQVKMRITEAPLVSMACHCKGCQKLTGGAYSLSLMLPDNGFEVTDGKPVIGALHGENDYFYCGHCMSWLFTRPANVGPFVMFRPTMLEDSSWVVPFVESFTAEKLPGVVTGASRSFDGFPAMEDYAEIMDAYAREGARPKETHA